MPTKISAKRFLRILGDRIDRTNEPIAMGTFEEWMRFIQINPTVNEATIPEDAFQGLRTWPIEQVIHISTDGYWIDHVRVEYDPEARLYYEVK